MLYREGSPEYVKWQQDQKEKPQDPEKPNTGGGGGNPNTNSSYIETPDDSGEKINWDGDKVGAKWWCD